VQKADHILILEQGAIIEYGMREQLLEDSSSKFSELLRCGIEEVLV
jgi:ATP-binding cassette subfamily B protein